MANESDKLLESNYDGIQEYDNDLPRWWVALFYLTIFFAVGYEAYYQFGPGPSQVDVLARDVASAEAAKQTRLASTTPKVESEADLLALTKNTAVVAKGGEIFTAKCLACHGPQGQGLVGPNLTDNFWIHGGKITDTLKVVEEGVLEKGMLAWKTMLSPDEIKSVVAFIYTLRGTNPPNAKPPQGEPAA